MTLRRPLRQSLAAVAAAMLALEAAAQETERSEPVGWPLRPSDDASKPAEALEDPAPETIPATKAPAARPPSPSARPAEPPAWPLRPDPAIEGASQSPAPRIVSPDADIGALDRIVLPIEPLSFSFAGERTALTRRETQALDRLALRLRLHPEPIVVTGSASQERHGREEALHLALTRALAVRHYLIEEGASEGLIEIVASAETNSELVTVAPLEDATDATSQ